MKGNGRQTALHTSACFYSSFTPCIFLCAFAAGDTSDYVTPNLGGGDNGEGYEIPDNGATVTNDHYAAADGGESTNMYSHLAGTADANALYSVVPQPEYDRLTPAGQRIENTQNYVVSVKQASAPASPRMICRSVCSGQRSWPGLLSRVFDMISLRVYVLATSRIL